MHTHLRLGMILTLGALLPAASLSAQHAAPAPGSGPRLEQTAAAMRAPARDAIPAVAAQARANSVGRPVALMAVGGAAIVLGALIGDDIGTLFSVAGAAALLYGLYLYLR